MSIASRLLGSGIPPLAATNICGDTSAALTATGSSQATALQLSTVNSYIGTTAASTGVILPAMSPGDCCYVHNAGASTLSVYGAGTIAIQGGSASAAFSVATNKGALFFQLTATVVSAILTA